MGLSLSRLGGVAQRAVAAALERGVDQVARVSSLPVIQKKPSGSSESFAAPVTGLRWTYWGKHR